MSNRRELDLVLMGATGFTGRLVATHLARHAPGTHRIGIAGRSISRLREVRDQLGARASQWELIEVDSSDNDRLRQMAARTRAIGSTAGPFDAIGLPLVHACVAEATNYADITGETTFIRQSIDLAHERAVANGTRIVHACGFDSVPSDLGTQFLASSLGEPLARASLVTGETIGGFSGGTVASMVAIVDRARRDPEARALLSDPYALSPDRSTEPDLGNQTDFFAPGFDPFTGRMLAPFLMAPINTRVVRRSNSLQQWIYGRSLRYSEAMRMPDGPAGRLMGFGLLAGIAGLGAALAVPPLAHLVERLLPKSGEGPSPDLQRRGRFSLTIHGEAVGSGRRGRVVVTGDGDPGYSATSRMFGEALLLLSDGNRVESPARAGVLTPATAFGPALRERLLTRGFTFAYHDQV
ncbi:MAG: enoyl-ACP reductase [Proteobacteria bacterium]|jgi:short subunit dehydrogenase-like uncharacterized protein|nr:enoyl-ACP reductase [Pseudomonadota bacterium]NBY47870.1 enoyl-ACP reductase [Pseudomonadota bacterium]